MIGANLFALTTTVAIIIGLSGASDTHVRVHIHEKVGEVGVWQQCGGKGYTGSATCDAGTSCTKINDWYSQCTPDHPGTGQVAWWGQCGGKDYKGSTTCAAGSVCKSINEWYSQCTPNNMQKAHHSQHRLDKSEENHNHLHTKEVGYWQQCGGIGYPRSPTCAVGSTCTVINAWYSQCIPDPSGTGTVAWWGQCGGKDYKGSTTCAAGSVCKSINEWYSQCTPNNMQKAHHSHHGLDKSEKIHLAESHGRCWQQCGGTGYTGPTYCGGGLTCTELNSWYWQCIPNSTEGGKVAWWGQCGGEGYTGLTTCTAGSVCKGNDKWFSQCRPQCQ